MAGEIQLNSTTMATESSGTITLSNVNSVTNRTNLGLGSMATQNANAVAITGGTINTVAITGGTINTVQPATGESLTIKDEDGNTAITVGTDNTAAGYLSLNFGSYHGDSGGAGSGTLSGNTLSDYEQGSWTPTGTNIHVTSTGTYTKVGNTVHITGYVRTNGTALNVFGGLPFTPTTSGGSNHCGQVGALENQIGSVLVGMGVIVNSSSEFFVTDTWIGSGDQLALGQYGTFIFRGSYITSS